MDVGLEAFGIRRREEGGDLIRLNIGAAASIRPSAQGFSVAAAWLSKPLLTKDFLPNAFCIGRTDA
jgi:hypothetical protein